MYDSRSIKVPKKLTKDLILSQVSESYIMRHYLGFDFQLNKAYKSPLRKESNPSFALYYNGEGVLRFKDFNGAQGSCFDLVMILFAVNFADGLKIIARDLNIGISEIEASRIEPKEYDKIEKFDAIRHLIQFKPKKYTQSELEYWQQYNITLDTLNKYSVYAAELIFLNRKLILRAWGNNPIFCYRFSSGNVKVYRPLCFKGDMKWLSNIDFEDVQGLEVLNFDNSTLIITKSLKDVMCLDSLGYSAIAPQSENTKTQHQLIKDISENFDNVVILFDNDNAGKLGAEELNNYIGNSKCIFIPDETCKDISDYIHKYSIEEADVLLKKLI